MRTSRTAVLLGIAIAGATLVSVTPAEAHGAMMIPGSRTFFCWEDGITSTGEIQPKNPACGAAVAQSGTNSLYNWFAVLRSDGAGRTSGFIPDGKLCSGANPTYAGFDVPNADWPVTHLTAGSTITFKYNKWAAHPGSFIQYITKDGWDPTTPLRWDEIESTPFLRVTDPPNQGPVGSLDGFYTWSGALPAAKTGRHIIYTVWQRSDSTETFYNCSDVVFDGGTGQVTGIGQTAPPGSGKPCNVAFAITNAWSGGFQAQVTVSNPSTTPMFGWTVSWSRPDGQSIVSGWNGTFSTAGSLTTVTAAAFNGSLPVGGGTTFGFVASFAGTPTVPTLSCTSP